MNSVLRINEVVPEIHFVALLQLKAPACTISVESTLALNPRCFGAKVVYVRTPGTHPPQCKAIHDSLSVLPNLEKSQETCSNALHMANCCPTFTACTPLMQMPYVPKSLPRALRNIRHLREWSTSSEGGAVSHSEIKCCKKDLQETNAHTRPITTESSVLHVTMPGPCFMPQLWYAQNKEWNW